MNAWDSIGVSNVYSIPSPATNEEFRDGLTTEYQTMGRAATALLRRFPDIGRDITRAKQNDKPLIEKIRKVFIDFPALYATICAYTPTKCAKY